MATVKILMIGECLLTAGQIIQGWPWQDGYTKVYERVKNKIKVHTFTLRAIP